MRRRDPRRLNDRAKALLDGPATEHSSALARAIRLLRLAVQSGRRRGGLPHYLSNLGTALSMAYERAGSLTALDGAIRFGRQAVRAGGADHPSRGAYHANLCLALRQRFAVTGDRADLDESIVHGRAAAAVAHPEDVHRDAAHINLAFALIARHEVTAGEGRDLDEAYEVLTRGGQPTPPVAAHSADAWWQLGFHLRERHSRTDKPADLAAALDATRHAEAYLPAHHPSRFGVLLELTATLALSETTEHRREAVAVAERALALTPPGDPRRPMVLTNLSNTLAHLAWPEPTMEQAERVLATAAEAAETADPADGVHSVYYANVAIGYRLRFLAGHELGDLDLAIQAQAFSRWAAEPDTGEAALRAGELWDLVEQRLDVTAAELPAGIDDDLPAAVRAAWYEVAGQVRTARRLHRAEPLLVPGLAEPHDLLMEHRAGIGTAAALIVEWVSMTRLVFGPPPQEEESAEDALRAAFAERDLTTVDAAVAALRQRLDAAPRGSGPYAHVAYHLALAYDLRHQLTEAPEDLDAAVAFLGQAVDAWPDTLGPDQVEAAAGVLLRLAMPAARTRTAMLDSIVEQLRRLDATGQVGPVTAGASGVALRLRYDVRGDPDDLDAAIDALERAGEMPGAGMLLAGALTQRAGRTGDAAEATRAYQLAQDVGAGAEAVEALRVRYLATRDRVDLARAVELTEELLANDPADPAALDLLSLLLLLRAEFGADPAADLRAAVAAGREAVANTPDDDWQMPVRRANYANARLAAADDSTTDEELAAALDLVRTSVVDGQSTSWHNLGGALWLRFGRTGALADLDAAADALRSATATSAAGPEARRSYLMLCLLLLHRYEHGQLARDVEELVTVARRLVSITPPDAPDRGDALTALAFALLRRHTRTGDADDIDGAVDSARQALAHAGTPLDRVWASNLATILRIRYKATGEEADAAEALSLLHEATAPGQDGDPDPTALANLGRVHYARWVTRGDPRDLDAAVAALGEAARVMHPRHGNASFILLHLGDALEDRYLHAGSPGDGTRAEETYLRAAEVVGAGPVVRVAAYANAAALAGMRTDWAGATERYRTAVAGLPAAVSHRATRRDREYQLGNQRTLASDAAAVALEASRTPVAFEMLEAARGVLLGQLLDLQTDLDALHARHPDLAGRLDSVRRELVGLTDDLTL